MCIECGSGYETRGSCDALGLGTRLTCIVSAWCHLRMVAINDDDEAKLD